MQHSQQAFIYQLGFSLIFHFNFHSTSLELSPSIQSEVPQHCCISASVSTNNPPSTSLPRQFSAMILCYANFKTSVMTIRFASITNRQTWLAFRLAGGGTRQEQRTGWLHLAETLATHCMLLSPKKRRATASGAASGAACDLHFNFNFHFGARSETFWKSRDPRRFPTDFLAAITFDALRFPPYRQCGNSFSRSLLFSFLSLSLFISSSYSNWN